MAHAGKVAIVTGSAGGIGRGIAEYLVKEGVKVVIADMNEKLGRETAAELNASKDGQEVAKFCLTDAASWESQCATFAFAAAEFGGRIDLVFGNAGIAQNPAKPMFHTTEVSDLSTLASNPPDLKIMDVNSTGVLYTTYLAIAYFRKQDKDKDGWRGKLVLTASNAAIYPFPADVAYACSKHGVLGLTKSIGPHVLKEGITVNCFGPSIVPTSLAPPGFIERVTADGRITPMTTVQRCVEMLIKPECTLTGQIVENCGERNVLRAIPPYLDSVARRNMGEFADIDALDKALDQQNYEVV